MADRTKKKTLRLFETSWLAGGYQVLDMVTPTGVVPLRAHHGDAINQPRITRPTVIKNETYDTANERVSGVAWLGPRARRSD